MNFAALVARREHDLSDQRAQRFCGPASVLLVGERLRELLGPLAVESGNIGMQVGHVCGRHCQTRRDLSLLPLQVFHPCFHRRLVKAILDRGHDAGDSALDLVERFAVLFPLRATLLVQAVGLLGKGSDRLGHRIGRHQPFL
ncbi:hypothetical protein [Mesorhizobium sp. M1E.F.Ca.ET.045.02.1.1]|uniref:hypothetical protein n=1 Tax=Mesorhizobium sp. M1E.F.Ca.ET.045.02.1.1 TaxID=2493672 RepID=UPI001FDF1002|nr:hypothetical protein [Mesorhizobium sp. M1E.F.Ca.ET.045.02.1.1]